MVRTSGGIRISAGKSSKKGGTGGGGGSSGGSSRSLPSAHSGKSGSKDAGPSNTNASEVNPQEYETEPSRGKEMTDINIDTDVIKKSKDVTEKDSIKCDSEDEQLPEKRRKEDKSDKENVRHNSEDNSTVQVIQNEEAESNSGKHSTNITKELTEKTEVIIEKSCKTDKNNINDQQLVEKSRKEEKTDDNTGNNSMELIQIEEAESSSAKQKNSITNKEATEKAEDIKKSCIKVDENNMNAEQLLEKRRNEEEKGKENIDGNTSN